MIKTPVVLRLFTIGLWLILIICNTINMQAQVNHMLGLSAMSSFQRLGTVDEINRNTIRVGMYMGLADHSSFCRSKNVLSYSTQIEYNRQWSRRFSTDVRLSGYLHHGFYEETLRGMGDLFIIGNYRLTSRVGLLLGVKTPLSDGNGKASDGSTLPMDFQTSAGTFDLIAGVSAQVWRLQIFAAWQQPLTRSDFNYPNYYYNWQITCGTGLDLNNWPPKTPDKKNRFHRAGQLFLRMKAPLNLGSRWILSPGLAFQSSITNDRHLDWESNYRIETQGFWSALSIDLDIPIKQNAFIHCMIAVPVHRVVERSFYNYLYGGLEYQHRF